MMRRLALALALWLVAVPAVGQMATIAPDVPLGDNSDRIANTKFVQSSIGAPALANGQFFIGNISNVAVAHALTGDCTSNNVGLITCTQSAGAFTVNGQLTVNGAIIDTSGNATLKTIILPGATSGNITVKAADVAGANIITLPAGTTDFSTTGGTSRFVAQATLGGPLTVVQPSCASLSGVAASCSTDTTNATNISTGTLGSARLPAFGSGDVSFATAGGAGTIAANAVTNAKAAQGPANTLKGNPTGVLANEQDVTLGATLTFSGTALQTTAHTGDATSAANSNAMTLANIPSGVPMAGSILGTNTAAPATPAAGKDSIWIDSTDLRLHDKNASGVTGTTVVSDTGAANNFLTGITAAGAVTKAQVAFSNLSGAATATQLPTPTATTIGGIESITCGANTWLSTISTAGVPTCTQPAFSNISGTTTTAQLGTNTATNAVIRQSAALSLIGNCTNATANVADVTGTANQVMVVNSGGTACAWGQVNLASASAVTGAAGIGNGGTGQITAAAARASSGLNVESFTGHGDSIYTILATDKVVGTNAAFTASRTWTLPAANTVNPGQPLLVADYQGTVTATNTLIIARGSTDTINGGTSVTINAANGAILFYSDGVSKWTAQAIGGGSVAGVSSFAGRTGAVAVQANDYGLFNGRAGTFNCALSTSVTTNNLTVSVTDATGGTPSATSPCVVVFRSATATTGSLVTRTITAATSVTLNSGSTLGTTSAVPFRVWVEFFDDGANAVLGVSVQSTASLSAATIFPLSEEGIQSTTACSACATATAAGTFYTTAALTSKAYRIAGMLEWNAGLTTAGTWATGATKVQVFTDGMKKAGDVMRTTMATTATRTLQSAASYAAALSGSITPTATMNLVRVRASGMALAAAGVTTGFVDLFRGTVAGTDLVSNGFNANGVANTIYSGVAVDFIDAPATTSSQTYTIGVKGDGTNSVGFPNLCAGTSPCATIIMDEIMGANDNLPGIPPLPLAG